MSLFSSYIDESESQYSVPVRRCLLRILKTVVEADETGTEYRYKV